MTHRTSHVNAEGFVFFAWHRLRWPMRTEHSNGCITPSCQRVGINDEWVCRIIWQDGFLR